MTDIFDEDEREAKYKRLIENFAEQVRSVGDIRAERANEGPDSDKNAAASKLCYDLSTKILKSIKTDHALDFYFAMRMQDEMPRSVQLDTDECIRMYISRIGIDHFPKTARRFFDDICEATSDVLLRHMARGPRLQ